MRGGSITVNSGFDGQIKRVVKFGVFDFFGTENILSVFNRLPS